MYYHRTKFLDEETFICSDTHFLHKSIMQFEPMRASHLQMSGLETHDEMIKDYWNQAVGPLDNVLHLGDFAWKGIPESIDGLNGDKYLILGNHDRRGSQTYKNKNLYLGGFKDVFHTVMVNFNDKEYSLNQTDELLSGIVKEIMGYQILFCHYPVYSENDYDRKNERIQPRVDKLYDIFDENGCDFNIHGHTHSKIVKGGDAFVDGQIISDCINVSMEQIDCKPMKIGEIIERHIRIQKEKNNV